MGLDGLDQSGMGLDLDQDGIGLGHDQQEISELSNLCTLKVGGQFILFDVVVDIAYAYLLL